MTCIKDHPHQMDGCPSSAFSWWIESKFHKPSGLCFHRIIYFQVSRAVCFLHNRSFLPFPHTCQLLSASAVIYVLLPDCITEFWKCVRVQHLEKPVPSHSQCDVTTPKTQMGTRRSYIYTVLLHRLCSRWQDCYLWTYFCSLFQIHHAACL